MRDRLFAIIKPETPASFDEKLDRLHLACCEMQNEYDDLLFPVEGDAEYADEEDEPFRWSAMFWSEACLKALTERLMSLEINKDDWRGLLADVHARIPELLARRADFLAAYADRLYEYDELLEYFVYRHFMKGAGATMCCRKGAVRAHLHVLHPAARYLPLADRRQADPLGADLPVQGLLARDRIQ